MQETAKPKQRGAANAQGPSSALPKQQNFAQHSQANSAFVSCWQNQRTSHNQQWNQKRSTNQNPNDFPNKFMPTYEVNTVQPNHNFFMPSFNNKGMTSKEPNVII